MPWRRPRDVEYSSVLHRAPEELSDEPCECGSSSFDVEARSRKTWQVLIRCCHCNRMIWRDGTFEPKASAVFRFGGGRFPGLSIDEVEKLPNGLTYLELQRDSGVAEVVAWFQQRG